jgi:phenylacetate-CoA ligase
MFHRQLFILAHEVGDRNFYSIYKKLIQNQRKSYEELKEEQEKQLKHMINFAYKNVPYYHNLFDNLKLVPEDIIKVEDLQRLPILTKEIIKSNWEDFKPVNLNKMKYYEWATGGSTGTPFKYRLSKFDRFLSGALLYRGWGYGGYELGDKMVFLAGSSLDIGKKSYLVKRVHEIVRNIKKFSSFDMGEKEMREYVNILNSFKPKFIRGYASSIYFFVKWIEENNLEIYQPLSVLTTAEKLHPHMKEKIGTILNCEVYDAYGLNDGGVTAYECSEHCGLHIDIERSIMEIADKEGNMLETGEGKILATSLYNYSMPFIRYDTGDLGTISNDICSCGRGYRLLKKVIGRQQEILKTPEGKYIHGEFFTHIFWEIEQVKEFQIIQEKLDKITIRIAYEKDFDEKQLDKIREIIRKRSEGWNVEFKFVDNIERTESGKYKFILNLVK